MNLRSHLSSHNSLTFSYQVTFRTGAVLVGAVSFMSLQPGDHAVIPTSGTFWLPSTFLCQGVQRGHPVHGGRVQRQFSGLVIFFPPFLSGQKMRHTHTHTHSSMTWGDNLASPSLQSRHGRIGGNSERNQEIHFLVRIKALCSLSSAECH